MPAVIAGEWWNDPQHQLSRYAMRLCDCPYHEQLRWDAECDRRDMVLPEQDEELNVLGGHYDD